MQTLNPNDRFAVTLNVGHGNNPLMTYPGRSRATAYAELIASLIDDNDASGLKLIPSTVMLMQSIAARAMTMEEPADIITFDVTPDWGDPLNNLDHFATLLGSRLSQSSVCLEARDTANAGRVVQCTGNLAGRFDDRRFVRFDRDRSEVQAARFPKIPA